MAGSPWVTAYQSVADGDGVLLPAQRAIKFGPGFVVVDAPDEVLNDAGGTGQVTGCSLVSFAGGGTSLEFLEDATEIPDVAAAGWLRIGEGPREVLAARVSADGNDRSLIAWENGDFTLGGEAATTTIRGVDRVSLDVDGAELLALDLEPSLADAPSVYIGTDGANCGIVIPRGVQILEFVRLARSTAGNAYNTGFSGQSATDGDGGDFTISGGDKAGTGTADGSVVLVSGGKEGLRCTSGMTTVGDPTNTTTASCTIACAVMTTVGVAGGAAALPGAPEGYARVEIAGVERLVPFWAIP